MILHGQLCGKVGHRREFLKRPLLKKSGRFVISLPMKKFEFSEHELREQCTEKVYARGEQMFRDGMVLSLAWNGETLCAEVQGSDDEPYSLFVDFSNGAPDSAECSCPYDWDGWCKHIVAALLLLLEEPDLAEDQISLIELLKPLKRRDLEALLVHVAKRSASVHRQIVSYIINDD